FSWARSSYLRQEPVQRRLRCLETLERTRRALDEAEARLQQLQEERARCEWEARSGSEVLLGAKVALAERTSQTLQLIRSMSPREFERLDSKRRELEKQEAHARRMLEQEKTARLAELAQRVEAVSSPEKAKEEALRRIHEKYVREALEESIIDKSNIPGLDMSPKTRDLLAKAGLRTAADISRERLRAARKLSAAQVNILLEWRAQLAAKARWRIPADAGRFAGADWRTRLKEREAELTQEREAFEARLVALTSGFAQLREALRAEEDALTHKLWSESPELSGMVGRESMRLELELKLRNRRLDAVDAKLAEARRACASLRWSQEETVNELASLESLQFNRYLKRLFPDSQ
ncbi:hypothetical protein, partial [Pyxidicoccus fallax]